MTHRYTALHFSVLLSCLCLPLGARTGIIPSPAGSSTEYHVEIGLTYASGMENVVHQMETNFGLERDNVWPIGLKLTAYAKTTDGLGFGGGIGPCEFIQVRDNNHYYHNNDDVKSSYVIPVFADLRYYFPRTGLLTPYVRAGVTCPIAGGDYIGTGTPGPVVAIGAHVWEHRILAIGVEAGYDASRVKVKSGYLHASEDVRPTEFTLSVFAAF